MSVQAKATYESACWSIQIPQEWEIEQDEECVTFISVSRLSAFQVSAATKIGEEVGDKDLPEFAADQCVIQVQVKNIKTVFCTGLYREYIESSTYWREWYLRAGNLMIFITYNIDEKHKDLEKKMVDDAINTIALR